MTENPAPPLAGTDDSGTNSNPAVAMAAGLYRQVRHFAGALGALVVIFVGLSISQDFFLTKGNILNVLTANSSLLIAAVGLTFIIISAGFDLSLGAIFAAAGYVVWRAIESGVPPWLALVLGTVLAGLLGGAVNGVLVGKFRLNFFVVTLGTSSLFTGVLEVITNGQTNAIAMPEGGAIEWLGNGELLGIRVPVIVALVVVLLAGYVLRFTSLGRAIYAVGGNPEAARLAGINVTAVYISVYAIAGFLAGVAGVVDASRLASADPTAGSTLALTAAAGVLLGGTSFFGGIGGVSGTVVGVLLMAFLSNGLNILGISAWWQGVITGLVLVLAVILDKLQTRASR
ncbi:ABC transporter permease [Nocardioides sp.]|uniref:ABC transporter permease n=1 Tax=Nocardioides sp. TaxID=35761 RepID=UPI0039E525A7